MSVSEPAETVPRRPLARRIVGRLRTEIGPGGLLSPAGIRARLITQPRWGRGLSDADFVNEAFQRVLDRPADPTAQALYAPKLATREWPRQHLIEVLKSSPEANQGPEPRLALHAFHAGRVTWTRSLPPAGRILDLGGMSLDTNLGALLAMRYPYDFDELIIVDLPVEDRHDLYKVAEMSAVESLQGPVRYLYRSMTDIADLQAASFDLICSGQTFEHITPDEGRQLLAHAARLLKPSGFLALDTPNRAATQIEVDHLGLEFINPDHKIEYTHRQMLDLFAEAGLRVVRQHGISYLPKTVETRQWGYTELIDNPGLFDDIERCYTLAYLVQPTGASAAAQID